MPGAPRQPSRGTVGGMLRATLSGVKNDEVATRAAALAFFTLLSLSPVLVLLVYGTTLLGLDDRTVVVAQLQALLGGIVGGAVEKVVDSASVRPGLGQLSAALSLAVLLVTVTAAFTQLQTTLNHVWNVAPTPGGGVLGSLRRQARSFAMFGAFGALLVASLAATTVVHALLREDSPLAIAAIAITSVLLIALAFTLLYRLVPAAVVAWRDATVGGVTTALLFSAGTQAIGVVVRVAHVGSFYPSLTATRHFGGPMDRRNPAFG